MQKTHAHTHTQRNAKIPVRNAVIVLPFSSSKENDKWQP